MSNLKTVKEQIKTIESIKLITQALGDIATSKIKETREISIHNIKFFQEITELYRLIKLIAAKSKMKHPQTRENNGKTVVVLLTANSKFYGDLDYELANFYMKETEKLDLDRIVVGTEGARLLDVFNFKKPFTKVKFKKDNPDIPELKSLSEQVLSYKRVLVFHNKFLTLLNQTPTVSDITGSDIENAPPSNLPIYYILEPELSKMLTFFETQILVALFQAVFLQVDIARTAARMISMNQAEDNADKMLLKTRKDMLKINKQLINLQVIQSYSSIMAIKEAA